MYVVILVKTKRVHEPLHLEAEVREKPQVIDVLIMKRVHNPFSEEIFFGACTRNFL